MRNAPTRRQLGVTLIETLMTLAITAVTLGSVVPGLGELTDRKRLEGVAAQLETELQFARGLAVERRETVRVSFQAGESTSCYVIHTGPANACSCETGAPVCTGGAEALRDAHFDTAARVQSASNSASIGFDPVKGTVTPTATIELTNARADRLRLVVNIMGRVRACSPSALPGYRAC